MSTLLITHHSIVAFLVLGISGWGRWLMVVCSTMVDVDADGDNADDGDDVFFLFFCYLSFSC
jgi:hypothetical protein